MSGYQVLLADDDSDDRELFREAVMNVIPEGELITAEDGSELLEILKRRNDPPPPHIIFLDINMPGKPGTQCLREIRQNPLYDNVPIVMFSTSTYNGDIDDTFHGGATLYVSKSVFFENEIENLRKILAIEWSEFLPKPAKADFVFK